MNNQILQIKTDLEETNKQNEKLVQAEKKLKDELEHGKTLYTDIQRAERTVRIDLEQTRRAVRHLETLLKVTLSKAAFFLNIDLSLLKFEKFRGLIIQMIYSVPGTPKPTGEITDDELLAQWKKIIGERTEFTERLDSLKENLKANEDMHSEFVQNVNNLESQMIGIEVSSVRYEER